jgi:ketosteroid isomerase-like protein
MQTDNLNRARHYLAAIERGAVGDRLAEFFAPEVVQEEFPNRLMPAGARRDLAAILEAAQRNYDCFEPW